MLWRLPIQRKLEALWHVMKQAKQRTATAQNVFTGVITPQLAQQTITAGNLKNDGGSLFG